MIMGKSRNKRFALSQVNKPYLKEKAIIRSSSLGDLTSVAPVGMSDQGLHQPSTVSSVDFAPVEQSFVHCELCSYNIDIEVDLNQYLICSLCTKLFHGDCLSIDENNFPYLQRLNEIGGWCCPSCLQEVRSLSSKDTKSRRGIKKQSIDVDKCPADGPDMLVLNSRLDSVQNQLHVLTDFLSSNFSFKSNSHNQKIDSNWPPLASHGGGGGKSLHPPKSFGTNVLLQDHNVTNRNPVDNLSDVLTAMHTEMAEKTRRRCNIVISGLPSSRSSDLDLTRDLFVSHLGLDAATLPAIKSVRRVGKVMADKPRLLIVGLTREEEVDSIMKSAKSLRNSIDPVLRNSVFINRDLTKAEAKAAYELRQRNKLRKLNPSREHEDGCSMDTLPVQQGISARDGALPKDLPVCPPSIILPGRDTTSNLHIPAPPVPPVEPSLGD